MKYVGRWGLMRSLVSENVAEHSLQVAWVAHALATIENRLFGGNYDACRIGMAGAYHETAEVITGDLPTPIKYFSPEMRSAYKRVESVAEDRILGTLPEELRADFSRLVRPDDDEKRIVKAADKMTAYLKCVEEVASGNAEFSSALRSIEEELHAFDLPSVGYFLDTFADAYRLSLDDLSRGKDKE